MDFFGYRSGVYACEGRSLEGLARRYGTPLYVYSGRTLRHHYRALASAFRPADTLICYSVKANSSLAICRLLALEGCGFDIVSGGELYRLQRIGVDPHRVVFAGVGKTDGEIKAALGAGVLFLTVESLPELDRIAAMAGRMRRRAPVTLRINPDVQADTHHHIQTGSAWTKFGMDAASVREATRRIRKNRALELVGIHAHIGSQITTTNPYIEAAGRVVEAAEALRAEGFAIRYVDLGGGFGIIYRGERPPAPAAYASKILPSVVGRGFQLLIEPGRFIVGNAGVLLARVLYVKKTPRKTFIVVDAAMNDLIRPALYGGFHEVLPVRKRGRRSAAVDVVGPICETGDFLARDRKVPRVEAGELIALRSAGAYVSSMASNYNSRLYAAEVLIDGGRVHLIRERQTYADLVRQERIPKTLAKTIPRKKSKPKTR